MKPLAIASIMAAALLSACSSTQDLLEPSAISPTASLAEPDFLAQPDASPAAGGDISAPPAANKGVRARVQLAPIVGASVEAANPLTQRLAARAGERNISLTGSADATATHVLKGYFSTMAEGTNLVVIYVWDVYDIGGNRLHRINGQQSTVLSGDGGWGSVTPEVMQMIADTTMAQFVAWLNAQPG